jgi:methionyl-tRNA synthetase
MEEPEHEAEIGIDAFAAVELRVAEILECEPVPKAKKLLKLQVDLGYEKRQVVSGIAKFYTPDQLVGKKVALVTNLKPAKLCGVDSYGMILASGEEDVKVVFLDPAAKNGESIH